MKKIFYLLLLVSSFAGAQVGRDYSFNRRVASAQTVVIDVAVTYGIVADGTTDNTTALMQMRTDCAGNGKPHYIFILPAGTITYTNNRWLFNIKSYSLQGAGSGKTILRNTYSGSDEVFQRPLFTGNIWQTNTLAYTGTVTYTSNHLFNTVAAGSKTITLTTLGDTINYAVGNRILLWGYDQVGNGFPPGTKYNEWNEIASIGAGTGVLTLKKALKYSYNSAWWDVPNIAGTGKSSGKPRITLLDRSDFIYPLYAGFDGLTFGAPIGGSASASGTFHIPGNEVVLHDVEVEGHFWPSMAELFKANNIRVAADPANFASEFDKIVGKTVIEDSYFRNVVSNGSGINSVIFNRCQFDESVQMRSQNIEFNDCVFRAGSYPSIYDPNFSVIPAVPIARLTINNATYLQSSANQNTNCVDFSAVISLTISNVSGNNIIVPFGTFTDASASKVYTLQDGLTRIFKADGSKQGTVTSVTFDATFNSGQGAFVIAGTWNVAPVAAEVWKWSTVNQFINKGVTKTVRNTLTGYSLLGNTALLKASRESGRIRTTVLTMQNWSVSGTDNAVDLYGKIVDVEIVVGKPYNGSDAACKLWILDGGYTEIFAINLKTAGRRYLNEFAASGSKTGDVIDNTKLGIWQNQLHFMVQGTSGNLSDQSEASLPIFELIIRTIDL